MCEKVRWPSYWVAARGEHLRIVVDEDGAADVEALAADGRPTVVLTCERVAEAYLRRLAERHISFVCVGRGALDRQAATLVLQRDFGIAHPQF